MLLLKDIRIIEGPLPDYYYFEHFDTKKDPHLYYFEDIEIISWDIYTLSDYVRKIYDTQIWAGFGNNKYLFMRFVMQNEELTAKQVIRMAGIKVIEFGNRTRQTDETNSSANFNNSGNNPVPDGWLVRFSRWFLSFFFRV